VSKGGCPGETVYGHVRIYAYVDLGMLPISVEVNKKYYRDGIKAILVKVGK